MEWLLNDNYIKFENQQPKPPLMRSIFTFLLILSLQILTNGQTNEEKENYNRLSPQAKSFISQAKNELRKENIGKAENLLFQSLAAYPIYPFMDEFIQILNYKKKIGDIKGMNIIFDSMIYAFNKYEKIITDEQGGGMLFTIHNYKFKKTDDIIVSLLRNKAAYNKEYGNTQGAYNDILRIEKYISLEETDYSVLGDCAILTGNFDMAKRCISELKKINSDGKHKSSDKKLLPFALEAQLYNATGEYDKVIPICEYMEAEDKGLNTAWDAMSRLRRAEAYAGLKEFDKAQEFLDKALKHIIYNKKSPEYNFTKGLIELLSNKYPDAIESFTKNLEYKPGMMANDISRNKYKTYTRRAEAYEGLKEFDKAKKDYEAALVYFPDYEPALNGRARLEGQVITARLTDKMPPEIIITEPLIGRGVILEAVGNEIVIKGMANDPGGIKSVTFNGEKAYSQEGGAFWGNYSLKDGINKVLIKATDFSGNTGEKLVEISRPGNASTSNIVPQKEGKNYALLIGCQNYDDSNIPSLEDPIPDAIKLKLILKNNYSFSDETILTLFNPELSDLKKQFLELYEIIQPEDDLVIFYAGHGIWVEKEKKGYWLFADAKLNDHSTWLPNKDVMDMIAQLRSRHTLLITDACFSGSLFKTRGLNPDMPLSIQQLNSKITRVAITSGNDTEVPDKSVFMKYLVKALSENKEKYLTAQKMFINQIIEAVMTETKTEPRYGTLELAGHVGGDFIFKRSR